MITEDSLERDKLTHAKAFDFLRGGGEMGRRVRAFDWTRTPLGPVGRWPEGLRAAVRIVMHSGEPMFVWWGRELINIYNDAAIPACGPRHPHALGRPAREALPDVWPLVGPQVEVVLQENRAARNDSLRLMIERDGYREETYFTFSYSPIPDEDGSAGGVFGVCRDDTQRIYGQRQIARLREEMAQALQEIEARYSAIVEGQSEMVCRFRPDGAILFVNGAYARARGTTPEALLKSNFWNFIAEVDRPGVLALLARLTPESPEIRIENRFETTEGVRWTLWTNRALSFDERGRAIELQSAGIDITERKRAEEALRQLNETLEQRVEQRTAQARELATRLSMAQQEERRYIAQILHDDLQQLLYGIEMKLTMIREDLQALDRPDLVNALDEGYGWIEQAINTARQLTVELSPPLLRNEGLADALEWLRRQMRDLHGMEVMVQADEHFFLEDPDLHVLLFQIVRELLFNVKKHAGVARVFVRLVQDGDDLVIQVSDHGRGFDLKSLGSRGEKAGGFGLFSIRERLNLIGGRLEVRSQPGQGTQVEARAPVRPRRAS